MQENQENAEKTQEILVNQESQAQANESSARENPGKNSEESKSRALGFVLKNKAYFLLLAAVIVFALVFSAGEAAQEYDYVVMEQGVMVASNDFSLQNLLERARKRNDFIIAPQIEGNDSGTEVGKTLALMQGVLTYYRKDVVSLLRVTDRGELVECYTNRGDIRTSDLITAEECSRMLEDQYYYVVRIDVDSKEKSPEIILAPTGMNVRARNPKESFALANFALNLLFPYYEEAVKEMNQVVGDLNTDSLLEGENARGERLE